MNTNLIMFSFYELALSLTFGMITIFIAGKVIDVLVLKRPIVSFVLEKNQSVSLFSATIIFSTLLMVHSSILPSVNSLQTLVASSNEITAKMFVIVFGYFVLYYLIALVISISVIFLSIYVYMVATVKVDELSEIKKDNFALTIILCVSIMGLTLFIKPSVEHLLGSLVNYEVGQHEIQSRR